MAPAARARTAVGPLSPRATLVIAGAIVIEMPADPSGYSGPTRLADPR